MALVGIRPTGVAVRQIQATGDRADAGAELEALVAAELERLGRAWSNVAVLVADEVWDHKGVEYDAVVVDARGMTAADVYLAASRAAHELSVVGLANPEVSPEQP